jgi:hypothetical protein
MRSESSDTLILVPFTLTPLGPWSLHFTPQPYMVDGSFRQTELDALEFYATIEKTKTLARESKLLTETPILMAK